MAAPDPGQALYRGNCAFCHGLTGLGGRGPALVRTQQSDDDLKRIIKLGIPGTAMPSYGGLEDADLGKLVGHLRMLAGSAPADEKLTGDPVRGKQAYAKNGCANCHQVSGVGSTYGPDLTRVGGARPAHYLSESITAPSNDIPNDFEGVVVTTTDGRKVQGVRVNQDTFTVQIRQQNEKFRSFILGKDAKEVTASKTSLMPAYKLAGNELDDLVAYLATLKASGTANGATKQSEGIK